MIYQFEFAEQVCNGITTCDQDFARTVTANLYELKEWMALAALEEECLRVYRRIAQLDASNHRMELDQQQIGSVTTKLVALGMLNRELLGNLADKSITKRGNCFEHSDFSVECNQTTKDVKLKLKDESKKEKYCLEPHLITRLLE